MSEPGLARIVLEGEVIPAEAWTAGEWLDWLRLDRGKGHPHASGLRDCADAIGSELAKLRGRLNRAWEWEDDE